MPIEIAPRFRGPPTSANGGYACGSVARFVDGPAEVTLRSPPPLATPMEIERDDGGVRLRHGETLVATARPASPVIDVPAPVSAAAAEIAAQGYPGFVDHPFTGCFVCGPARAVGDGLRIFPGPVAGRGIAAAPWRPDPSVCGADGLVHPECVWAALDCPSYFGAYAAEGALPQALLGRMTARLDALPRVGESCVLVGWELGRDGRKLHTGSALFSEERGLLAAALATWITVDRAP